MSEIGIQAGDYEAAASYLMRAVALARMTGNRLDIVKTLTRLSRLEVARGNMPMAERRLREAAAVGREIGAAGLLVDVVAGLADLALRWIGTATPRHFCT